MLLTDPKDKNIVNGTSENNYDDDNQVTNTDNPVREGQENSSILHDEGTKGDAEYVKLNEYDNHPREQEEFVDDDANNITPED